MELWRLLHLDPESEPGVGFREEDGSVQVSNDERPEFDGGSDETSPVEHAIPADPNNRVQHSAPAAAATEEWTSIRDAARQAGFDFGHGVTDDAAALNLLLQKAQASRQQSMYEQLGRQLAPRAEELQRYLQGGQQLLQQAPDAQKRKPWEAPEFDRRWAALVDRDSATGLFFSKPGTPPEIAQKVNEYVEWKDRYDANPSAVMNEMVRAQAQEEARKIFAEQFAEQQRNYEIQRITTENRSWMYQQAPGGGIARDFDGQPVMTPHGSRYIYHVEALHRAGVQEPSTQDRLAKELVRGEWTNQYYSQQQQAAQADPGRQAATSSGRDVNPAQTRPPSIRKRRGTPEPTTTGMSLQEAMARAFKEENITEDDIRRSVDTESI
jgi:hypothetical protein